MPIINIQNNDMQESRKRIELICAKCGKHFYIYNSRRHRGIKHCSKECSKGHKESKGYDISFLDSDSELRSYFLGFFMGDGGFYKNGTVYWNSVDKQLIYSFANKFKYTNSIIAKKNNGFGIGKKIYRLQFYGEVSNKFKGLGFSPGKKSHRLFLPECVSEYTFNHFLRGFIDADGSFFMHKTNKSKNKYHLNCKLASIDNDFLDKIHHKLLKLGIVHRGSIQKYGNCYSLLYGHQDSINIGSYIYKNFTIKLDRKFEKYIKARNLVSLSTSIQINKICSITGCNNPCRTKGLCLHHFNKQYREKNKEKLSLKNKEWRFKNIEKLHEYGKEYYNNNKEKWIN